MIRPYNHQDKGKLIELLQLNTPAYFDPIEEKDFVYYLDNHSGNYFVVEEDDSILGSGGFNFSEDRKMVRISWDIIHPAAQGKGLGSKLTKYRIDKIKEHPEVEIIMVRTSQLVFPFYEKFGFEIKEVVKDFWAKGFDLVRMELRLK
jgi:ribosomal-protein-alanine N-acetyltransferase